MLKVNQFEYTLMRKFIEEQCGICLEKDKEYLIESRLTDLAIQNGCDSFEAFHTKARSDYSGNLKAQIVDAMTTNETLWFRDKNTWKYLKEVGIPGLLDQVEKGKKVRIWSAAASTGQEAYSLVILFHEEAKKRGKTHLLNQVEIIGTDISTSVLFLAKSGRYDSMAMGRGMPDDKKHAYFTQKGNVWELDQELKKRVTFKHFNLQNDFTSLGKFDLILCRYVIIYFADSFKKKLFSKMLNALSPESVLLLGATETLRGFSDNFNIYYYKDTVLNEKPLEKK
jgi:chemotaxis protein methyltransferase CheR